jgi:hypothetical protein
MVLGAFRLTLYLTLSGLHEPFFFMSLDGLVVFISRTKTNNVP